MTHLIAGIFDIVVGCAMLLFFIRFMFQFAQIDAKDPAGKVIYNLTRIVDIFGRIFPTLGNGRINTAAIVLMLLIRLIFMWGVLSVMREDSGNLGLFSMTDFNHDVTEHLFRHFAPWTMFFCASMTLILDFLRMAQYLLIASFIGSWVVMFTQNMPPILGIITQLTEPIIEPFRKFIPPMGMFDLAPMIGFFMIILLELVVQTMAVFLLTL